MIEFNEIFCLDLKDDFEELGRDGRNFTLDDLIQGDLSRAFAFGYCHFKWIKEKMWFPISIRKTLRHLPYDLNEYIPQLEWLNEKCGMVGKKVKLDKYATYILENVFCDDYDTLLKIAILVGANISPDA